MDSEYIMALRLPGHRPTGRVFRRDWPLILHGPSDATRQIVLWFCVVDLPTGEKRKGYYDQQKKKNRIPVPGHSGDDGYHTHEVQDHLYPSDLLVTNRQHVSWP